MPHRITNLIIDSIDSTEFNVKMPLSIKVTIKSSGSRAPALRVSCPPPWPAHSRSPRAGHGSDWRGKCSAPLAGSLAPWTRAAAARAGASCSTRLAAASSPPGTSAKGKSATLAQAPGRAPAEWPPLAGTPALVHTLDSAPAKLFPLGEVAAMAFVHCRQSGKGQSTKAVAAASSEGKSFSSYAASANRVDKNERLLMSSNRVSAKCTFHLAVLTFQSCLTVISGHLSNGPTAK